MPMKKLTYSVLEADAGRIDILVARLLDFSRARVRGLMDHEGVTLNGEECQDYGTHVAADDVVVLTYDPERKYREKPPERKTHGFTLIFRDEHLAIVNKDAGILTVPTDRREKNTLVDLLSNFLAGGQARGPKVSVVHRLDRDTSGLLVFGQRPAIAENLIKQFSARKPEREYYAIVAGKLSQDKGEIRSLLQTDKALNQRSSSTGELAITHYRVITRYQDATMVAVNLETGRRNQIRVHFAEMGHPILGDTRYEADRASHPAWPYKRLALHARMLGFSHPMTRRELRFESDLPDEFKKFTRAYS
ncbi:MAG TPA: RluA family pseudouridine synthase [Oligoflexus sp.]|uniref:RluA family pseudouridine synthase n=1 Tax=Oligoflexus sp. TaxID=1971216 RepID=UPI002D230BFD|nr:RluA family pseudouridine synthase [Oligoflexus sp.]HYX33417.1 RluA family pseudouridine synthase [Oligoflexus sp.]